jgi:hypothetical protein
LCQSHRRLCDTQGCRYRYFDRLGKAEKIRRHVYSLTLTPVDKHLWLGLLTNIEWPKQGLDAKRHPDLPAHEGDTTNIYLVTSRDGVHVDDEWVYAQQPLVPKGAYQHMWNAGFLLHATQIVTDQGSHRVYFEAPARPLRAVDTLPHALRTPCHAFRAAPGHGHFRGTF